GNWPDEFKCAVNHDGVFDTFSMGFATEELWFTEWENGGTPFDKPENYEKFNPVNHVAKWRVPMLVVQGEKDYRVSYNQSLEFFTPPEVRPSNVFSKVALVRTERQIYISSVFARVPSRGEPQGKYVFEQLQEIVAKTGSDMRHLVKGTYYVCDDDAARWVDRTRPLVFDPDRPPAASKVMVHGMSMEGRTMTVDMIAVEAGK
ncbi:MAG: prolyl oligopeptidase family serine peptidase, partial [Pirellulales bacterium]|nr:prolyl oligopeptidase family serine peptidase [Pirellulales bacterium]